jgi:hypothetical protein
MGISGGLKRLLTTNGERGDASKEIVPVGSNSDV